MNSHQNLGNLNLTIPTFKKKIPRQNLKIEKAPSGAFSIRKSKL